MASHDRVPSVSVIVPTFNRRELIGAAIDSIRSHRASIQIIVVDDGSSDGTHEWLGNATGICLLRQANAGPSAARNAGLRRAEAQTIAFLDSDDLWPEGSLDARLAVLDDSPDVDFVMGLTQPFGSDDAHVTRPYRGAFLGSGLFRRRIYDRIGGFDEERRSWEDLDWLNRAREAGFRQGLIDEVTLRYRIHGGNMGRDEAISHAGLVDAVRASIGRRER